MQPTQQPNSLPYKSFYFGGGSIAILILEVVALVYGISDGSLMFVVPLLISPILSVVGIVLGIMALKRKNQPRELAVLGIICCGLCMLLFIGFFAFAIALASSLQGIF